MKSQQLQSPVQGLEEELSVSGIANKKDVCEVLLPY